MQGVRAIAVMLLAPLTCALVASCTQGHRVAYSSIHLDLAYSGQRTLAIAVHDKRPRVASGEWQANHVGETRFVAGKQAPLVTDNEQPLAAVTAGIISSALEAKGFKPVTVEIAPADDEDAIQGKLKSAETPYSFWLTINNWWSAIHRTTTLEYDLELKVLDANGNEIARAATAGEKKFGEGAVEAAPSDPGWGAPAAEEPAPEPAPAPAPAVDADAFDQPAPAPADEEPTAAEPDAAEPAAAEPAADAEPAEVEGPPTPAAEEPDVREELIAFYKERLSELINDPQIPKVMQRFDPAPAAETQPDAPLEAAGSFTEPPPPPPPE